MGKEGCTVTPVAWSQPGPVTPRGRQRPMRSSTAREPGQGWDEHRTPVSSPQARLPDPLRLC